MAGSNVDKNRKFGGYKFDTWHKDKDSGVVKACGGESSLGAAQKWAKGVGRQVPTHVNSSSDFRDVVSNCKAYKSSGGSSSSKSSSSSSKGKISDQLGNYAGYVDGVGMTAAEYDLYADTTKMGLQAGYKQDLQTLIGNQQLALQGLINEANALSNATSTTNVQISEDAASWRTKYAADSENDWRKYLGSLDAKTRTDVAKIQGEYSLDLQDIINAGNKEVENIRGEFGLAGDKVRGEYSKDIEGIKGEYQKDIAKTNKEASIFGNFLAGFW